MPLTTKRCPSCEQDKPLEDFMISSAGVAYRCAACRDEWERMQVIVTGGTSR